MPNQPDLPYGDQSKPPTPFDGVQLPTPPAPISRDQPSAEARKAQEDKWASMATTAAVEAKVADLILFITNHPKEANEYANSIVTKSFKLKP